VLCRYLESRLKKEKISTVTHPDIIRYLLSILKPVACASSWFMGVGGEIFVLDMGEPVNRGFAREMNSPCWTRD